MVAAAGRHDDAGDLRRAPTFSTTVSATIGIRIRRLLRLPVFVFGKLIVVLGIVAVIVAVLLCILLAIADEPPTQGDWIFAAVTGVGGIVAVVVGRVSVRGRRHLVLFLRKFRYREATAAPSYAAERAMGRRWRLVTLDDDHETAPIGVSPGLRRRSNLLGFLGLVLIVTSIAFVAYWFLSGGPDDLLEGLVDGATDSFDAENPDTTFGESFGAAFVAVLGAAILLIFVLVFGFVALLTLLTACMDMWITRMAVRRAERSKAWRMER